MATSPHGKWTSPECRNGSRSVQSWRRMVLRGLVCILVWFGTPVSGQCESKIDPILSVKETDEAGTLVTSIPERDGGAWSYKFNNGTYQPVSTYLNFSNDDFSYNLTLVKPLDLEELRDKYQITESAILITLTCKHPTMVDVVHFTLLNSIAVNEFQPEFNTTDINVYVRETPTHPTTVVNLIDWAWDKDNNPITPEINGFSFNNPSNLVRNLLGIRSVTGSVYTKTGVDFESFPSNRKYLKVGVLVKDTGNSTGTATLTIHIVDVDDLPPKFTYPACPSPCLSVSYSARVSPTTTGKLTGITPAPVQAEDGDTLNAGITYSIVQGPDDHQDYFSINPTSGDVIIIKALNGLRKNQFVLIVQAKENTVSGRSSTTSLLVSVEDGAGPTPLAAQSSSQDDVVIVGVVLGVTVFIILAILIVAMIYYHKRYRKVVHPIGGKDGYQDTTTSEKGGSDVIPPKDDHPRSVILTDEQMKVDEEMTTWLPASHLADIVDLSDEDTLKKKKKNGVPPNSTHMTSRDSAFDDWSDKKSSSGDSHKDIDPDFDPVTEYAEVGMPTEYNNDLNAKSRDHVYVPDPTSDRKSADFPSTINDSGVEEAEYLTPNSTRVKMAANKSSEPDTGLYSDLIRIDDDASSHDRHDSSQEAMAIGAAAHVQKLEGKAIASSSPKPKFKKSEILGRSQRSLSDEAEVTEYSTPRSENSRSGVSLIESPRVPDIADDGDDDKPEVPPRPKVRQVSGLKLPDSDSKSEEIHYASVQKKSSQQQRDESPGNKVKDNKGDNSKDEIVENEIDPPIRRKRHRKRSRQVRTPEEDVYDGTKDYEDLEMDPEFYLDPNKARVKRSSRVPPMQIDPDDTRYWITVTDDY